VELIVVIAIITLLMALLAVFIVGVITRAQNAKAKAIVDGLDKACQTYRLQYNVYPANDRGDSRCLHYYLGGPQKISKGLRDDGTSIIVNGPPILQFPTDWLQLAQGQNPDPKQPVPVIDPWGNAIKYKVPGQFNKTGVDIWSMGANGQDDLVAAGQDTDDISNWNKEY
jgi:type II secretory pathway pseudopilin PulG